MIDEEEDEREKFPIEENEFDSLVEESGIFKGLKTKSNDHKVSRMRAEAQFHRERVKENNEHKGWLGFLRRGNHNG